MIPSTLKDKKTIINRILPAVIWLALWQILAMVLDSEIILASPIAVIKRLPELAITLPFWKSIYFSVIRITIGFLSAVIAGVLLAVLSSKSNMIKYFLDPFMKTISSIPVASFIILVLLWVSSSNLNVIISFLIVLPIMYTNVLEGIFKTDENLLEMATVFRFTKWKKIRYIYFSQVMPFFSAAFKISLGLAWKSGIAAEVIAIPMGSIGESLYQSKVYLDTPNLFAWTLSIVLVSMILERIFLFLLSLAERKLEQ